MPNEALVERNRQLERSVKRWRLVSLVLALLLICAVAIGGIVTAIPRSQEPGGVWLWLPWIRAREAELRAREAADQARLEAVRAEQAAAERRAAKPAEDESVKKQP
jgi:hypothetical protein